MQAALTKPPPIYLGLDHDAPTAAAHYASDESLAAVADSVAAILAATVAT